MLHILYHTVTVHFMCKALVVYCASMDISQNVLGVSSWRGDHLPKVVLVVRMALDCNGVCVPIYHKAPPAGGEGQH
jgi:hypothetical protein